MKEIVKKIIDEWDPIDVFPLFPNDEYDTEIDLITEAIIKNINEDELTNQIYEIFKKRLGSGFLKTKVECKVIANIILKSI